jgi:hypothetical protein
VPLPNVDRCFTVSEEGDCYGRVVRSLRTVVVAIAGLALPVGLALAVYLASAGTIAARPPAVDFSGQQIGQPSAPDKAAKKPSAPRMEKAAGTGTGTSATGTTEDHGAATSTEDNSGPGGGASDNSGPSDSSGPGSGSDSGSNSGPGGGDDD